jgi:hypothetical protein
MYNQKTDAEIREEEFRDKFPEEWICPYCAQMQLCQDNIKRDEILNHVNREHGGEFQDAVTWELFYNRMILVGGI